MDDQIGRYYDWCGNAKYEVSAVIYLTLDGIKQPPPVKDNVRLVLKSVGTVGTAKSTLLRGWIEPSLKQVVGIETASLLYQYSILLRHMGAKAMERQRMEAFYGVVNENKNLETVRDIVAMSSALPEYRRDRLQAAIEDYAPFLNSAKYGSSDCPGVLYFNFNEGPNGFKLDIYFYEDGSAEMIFWNPLLQTKTGLNNVKKKLEAVGFEDEFKYEEETEEGGEFYRYKKRFAVAKNVSLEAVDNAVEQFAKNFMAALKSKG
jgi:hypothetical protein